MINVAIYSDLGNRISPLCSAIALARERNTDLRIFWEIAGEAAGRNEFRCSFERLYQKPDIDLEIVNGRPCGFNTIFDQKMHIEKKRDLLNICENEDVCIRLPYPFHSKWREEAKRLDPVPEIKDKVDETANRLKNTIGIHIRRTDNTWSIRYSPTAAFYEVMDEEIAMDKSTTFFLATDSVNEEKAAIERYGERIIVYPKRSRARNFTEGVQDALIDMYCLSRTKSIIGSHCSTFSAMAAIFNNTPIRWICIRGKR